MPKIQLQLKLPLLLLHPNSLHPLLLHPRFAVRYCIRIQPCTTVSVTKSATASTFSRPLLCLLPSPLLHPHSAVRYRVRYCIHIQPSTTVSVFSRPLLCQLLHLRRLRSIKAHAHIRLYLASEVLARSIIDVACINGDDGYYMEI